MANYPNGQQPAQDPIGAALSGSLQMLMQKRLADSRQQKPAPLGIMGADSGVDPNSADYYRGLLRQNMMQAPQAPGPMPVGGFLGPRYA